MYCNIYGGDSRLGKEHCTKFLHQPDFVSIYYKTFSKSLFLSIYKMLLRLHIFEGFVFPFTIKSVFSYDNVFHIKWQIFPLHLHDDSFMKIECLSKSLSDQNHTFFLYLSMNYSTPGRRTRWEFLEISNQQ